MTLSLDQALGQLDLSTSRFDIVDIDGLLSLETVESSQVHLIFILRGKGSLSAEQATFPLTAGLLLVVNSGQLARISGQDMSIGHALLSATLLDGRRIFDFVSMPHYFNAAGTELFISAIPELLKESANGGPGSAAIVVCLLRRVITQIVRHAWPEAEVISSEKVINQSQRLEKIVSLMKKDPARQYTLESLSSAAGMSRTVFHKTFVEAYGHSPSVLLRTIRLQRAHLLLKSTELPIKVIALRLGFRSRSYFWTIFKQAYGIDPEGFRSVSSKSTK